MSKTRKDELRPEYDLDLLKGGVQGKHYKRYQESTNVVVIEPDLAAEFPNAKAVNDALRELLARRAKKSS